MFRFSYLSILRPKGSLRSLTFSTVPASNSQTAVRNPFMAPSRSVPTNNSSTVNRPVNKADMQKNAKEAIKKLMYNGSLPRAHAQVLDAMYVARRENVTLDIADYETCITAASQFRGANADIAFTVYDLLKQEGNVSSDMFPKLMNICLHRNNAKRAVEVTKDLVDRSLPMSEHFLCSLLTVLAGSNSEEYKTLVDFYYKSFKTLVTDKGFRSQATTYTQLATYYCRIDDGSNALKLIRDMTDVGHEPTPILCNPLLDAALFVSQASVLQVLASWYANSFNIVLEYGVLSRMCQIAAAKGDATLAQSTFEIMSKTGRTPTIAHFACYLKALLRNKDLVGAIEALQEMESMGLLFQPNVPMPPIDESGAVGSVSETSHAQYLSALGQMESIKSGLLKSMLTGATPASMEELYFILVDQVNQGKNVPRLVLDVLVEALARLDMTDRSFAVFQDYRRVFNTIPDIHSYNSLLAANACARVINLRTLLAVFQEIETPSELNNMVALKPNETSFSILLTAIADEGSFQSLFEILAYMGELKIDPSLQSLRRLIIALVKADNETGMEVVKKLLIRQQDNRGLPIFLKNRISQIRKKHELAFKAKRDAWEATGSAARVTVGKKATAASPATTVAVDTK